MSIDLLREEPLTLSQAARRLPRLRRDRPVSPSTIYRWIESGVNGIRLESARLGGRRVTSVQALERFFALLNGETVQRPCTSASQDGRHKEVERELLARGI